VLWDTLYVSTVKTKNSTIDQLLFDNPTEKQRETEREHDHFLSIIFGWITTFVGILAVAQFCNIGPCHLDDSPLELGTNDFP
jgi:hypothetical protein